MQLFLGATGLVSANPEKNPPLPSRAPKRELDFILHSPELRRSQIPPVIYSDHAPLICDFPRCAEPWGDGSCSTTPLHPRPMIDLLRPVTPPSFRGPPVRENSRRQRAGALAVSICSGRRPASTNWRQADRPEVEMVRPYLVGVHPLRQFRAVVDEFRAAGAK